MKLVKIMCRKICLSSNISHWIVHWFAFSWLYPHLAVVLLAQIIDISTELIGCIYASNAPVSSI